jgi:hypothetical protein
MSDDVNRTTIIPEIPGAKPPAAQPAEGTNTQRPEGVPEKFWKDGKIDTDGLLKSYSELEKKNSGAKPQDQQQPPLKVDESQPKGDEGKPAEGQQPAGNELPPQYKKYDEEFRASGKLSDESYAELTKTVPREYIDAYISMTQAKIESETASIVEVAGGSESYAEMTKWARENLSKSEKDAFNKALDGGLDAAKLAVSGLYQKYTGVMGKAPQLINGRPSGGDALGYRSWEEVTSAMSDPRYKNDPAYRKDVEKRLAASNI